MFFGQKNQNYLHNSKKCCTFASENKIGCCGKRFFTKNERKNNLYLHLKLYGKRIGTFVFEA